MIKSHELHLTLRPLGMGEAPQCPPLRHDARGIVTGPQGLVLLKHQRDRAAFLAALSHEHDLSTGVTVEQIAPPTGDESVSTLIILHPPENDTPLSLFYERVQDAIEHAHLTSSRAWFCIGGRATPTLSIFVPYANPAAPAGFDVDGTIPDSSQTNAIPDDTPLRSKRLVLTPRQSWWIVETTIVPLREILQELPLQRIPISSGVTHRPTMLSLLADRRMAALIATYVQRHMLTYVVRFLTWQQGDRTSPVALFDISSGGDGQTIPVYVSDFLARLPRTTLLTDALEPATLEHEPLRRVLVAYGRATPFSLPNVQGILPPASLLLLSDGVWQSALLERLSPRHTMHQIVRTDTPPHAHASISAADVSHLQISFVLRRDDSRRSVVHGILLDERGQHRLRRMLRSLPAPLFAHLRVALGEGFAVILADSAHQTTITGIPIGQPIARSDPPELLLPTGTSLLPVLPAETRISILGLRADTVTLLTSTHRYDLPLSTFSPLSRLVAPPSQETLLSVRLQPSLLPPLDLDDLANDAPDKPAPSAPHPTPVPMPSEPPRPVRPSGPPPPPQRGLRGFLQQLTPGASRRPVAEPSSGSFTEELREEARRLEQAGEYELAAAFYRYLQEDRRAAHCYRRLLKQ